MPPTLKLHFRAKILEGLLVLIPIVLTVLFFRWFFFFLDGLFLSLTPGEKSPFPGFGILCILLSSYALGVLVTHPLFQNFLKNRFPGIIQKEEGIMRIINPFLHWIRIMTADDRLLFRKTVILPYPRQGMSTIAYVTNKFQRDGTMMNFIFIPTLPNPLTGLLLFGPDSDMTPCSLNMEEASKMILSVGLLSVPKIPDLRK